MTTIRKRQRVRDMQGWQGSRRDGIRHNPQEHGSKDLPPLTRFNANSFCSLPAAWSAASLSMHQFPDEGRALMIQLPLKLLHCRPNLPHMGLWGLFHIQMATKQTIPRTTESSMKAAWISGSLDRRAIWQPGTPVQANIMQEAGPLDGFISYSGLSHHNSELYNGMSHGHAQCNRSSFGFFKASSSTLDNHWCKLTLF